MKSERMQRARLYLRTAFNDQVADELLDAAQARGGYVSDESCEFIRRRLGDAGLQMVDCIRAGSRMSDRSMKALSDAAGAAWVGPEINDLLG